MMMSQRICILIIIIALFAPASWAQHIEASRPEPVPASLFDLNIIGINKNTGWPRFPFASWRSFHSNWQDLEPSEGKWDFTRVDNEVQAATEHKVDLLLILQGVPKWAADVKDPENHGDNARNLSYPHKDDLWANYVRTVAERYRGKVHYYELWNEPENLSRFRNSPDTLAHLNEIAYKTLKAVDPGITVVSSSLSSGDPVPTRPEKQLKQFDAAGVLRWSDAIGYHFYSTPPNGSETPQLPENIVDHYKMLTAVIAGDRQKKPVWCTEVGWYVSNDDSNPEKATVALGNAINPDKGAAYLARTYILAWTLGIDRVYWYAWRHGYMGMTQYNGAPKATETAYESIQNWLVDSTVHGCDRAHDGSWQCSLTRRDGQSAHIVWSENGTINRPVDPSWKAVKGTTLDGHTFNVAGEPQIRITEAPILLSR
jgi:hypothetical protein